MGLGLGISLGPGLGDLAYLGLINLLTLIEVESKRGGIEGGSWGTWNLELLPLVLSPSKDLLRFVLIFAWFL